MSKLRVMIVDDDVRVRRCLSDLIGSQLIEFEVVAVTSSLATAIARLEHSTADLLVVDFDLVESAPPDLLAGILQNWPELRVLSYRTSQTGILKKIHSILLDTKRIQVFDTGPETDQIAEEALKQLQKALLSTNHHKATSSINAHQAGARPAGSVTKRPRLIVIGVSTGGPNALAEVIPNLPDHLSVPVLIVQHMPMAFIPSMAERLNSISRIDVKVARHGEVIKGPVCRIAPGECHLEVRNSEAGLTTLLTNGPPENSCKPAADVLFRSAAATCGAEVLGVVLTGMGRDGCAGARTIYEAGGKIIAQDERTSVVWGMPGSVVESNLTDKVLPLHEIADEIVRRSGRSS